MFFRLAPPTPTPSPRVLATHHALRTLHLLSSHPPLVRDAQDGNKILVFGGQGSGADFFNDLHLLDLCDAPLRLQQLAAAGDPPFPRCSGTLTAVSVLGLPGTEVVALFGGSQGFFEGFSNSLCILRGDDSVSVGEAASQHKGLTWEEPIVEAACERDGVPDARWGHSAVSWRGKLILFGGSNTQHCFNDTWILDVSHKKPERGEARARLVATWRRLRTAGDARPPSRAGQTVSLVGDSLYVFGGCHISDVFNDLWTLDLSEPEPTWRELHVSGRPPAPRVGHAAVVLGDRIVFSGGRGSPTAGTSGTFATADQGLATMQGLTFFEGGFAMLDVSRRRWMPIQHPVRGAKDARRRASSDAAGDDAAAKDAGGDVVMEEADEHVLAEALAETEPAFGGAGDNFTSTVHVEFAVPPTAAGGGRGGQVWEHRTGHVMVPAKDGLLVIGGLAYNGEFQNDVQHIKVF